MAAAGLVDDFTTAVLFLLWSVLVCALTVLLRFDDNDSAPALLWAVVDLTGRFVLMLIGEERAYEEDEDEDDEAEAGSPIIARPAAANDDVERPRAALLVGMH